MIKFILTDIEGSASSGSFANDVLLPFSRKNLSEFVYSNTNNEEVLQCLYDAQEYIQEITGKKPSRKDVVQNFLEWIEQDVKHTSLNKLQGMLWKKGYESGAFKGHIYADVPGAFAKWKEKDIIIGTYSLGQITTQKLLFKHSSEGDLTTYLSAYFDLGVGPKKDIFSYFHVADKLNLAPAEILYISDNEEELEAARKSGMQVVLAVRKEENKQTPLRSKYFIARSFGDIDEAL